MNIIEIRAAELINLHASALPVTIRPEGFDVARALQAGGKVKAVGTSEFE